MAPASRLGRQIQEIIHCLHHQGAAAALIGGLALAPYDVIRATSDIELLADAGLADAIDRELRRLGYECLHRSTDVANYVRGDERVDFLFANRPVAAALLASALPHQTPFGELRANRDRVDLRAVPDTSGSSTGSRCLTMSSRTSIEPLVPRTAFVGSPGHFDRPPAVSPASDPFTSFDELMAVIEALCPVWPKRPALTTTPDL